MGYHCLIEGGEEMKVITSQSYIDPDIVAEKLESRDFDVFVTTPFELDGVEFVILVDGNHSFEAARQAGVEPTIHTIDMQQYEMAEISAEEALERCWMDGDYRDAVTGELVW